MLALIRVGDDVWRTAPEPAFAVGMILRSFGTFGLLFAGAGLTFGLLLRLAVPVASSPERVATWVASMLSGSTVLLFLTVRRQLDRLGGLPLSAPERRWGAALDLGGAVLVTVVVLAILGWFARRRKNSSRYVRAALVSVTVLAFAAGVGETMLQTGRAEAEPGRAERVVVIGLDGLTFRVLSPLLKEGRLPTFERLLDEGAWGTLMTYGTASSPRIWTSMATGKRTRTHGIDDFVKVSDGYAAVPYKSSDRRVLAIWNILSDRDRRVAFVDWHITYPPEEVHGAMISRLFLDAEGRTHPPELDDQVRAWLRAAAPAAVSTGRPEFDRRLSRLFEVGERLLATSEEPYDLLALYTTVPDSASHGFWKQYEADAFDHATWGLEEDDIERHKDVVPNVYEAVDASLARLLERIPEDALLVVVSDHGLRAAQRPRFRLRLDRMLADLDFAELRQGRTDPSSSRAYQLTETLWKPTLRVNLNVADREPDGIVPARRAESLRRRLVGLLEEVRFENGDRLFSAVRSEPFGRRRTTSADVELVPRSDLWDAQHQTRNLLLEGRPVPLARFAEIDTSISGSHDRQGVLLLHGPGVRPGYIGQKTIATPFQEIVWNLADKIDAVDLLLPPMRVLGLLDPATTLDLTPMLLHVLDEPVARDMDGRPRPGFWASIPDLRWVATYEDGRREITNDDGTASDAEELERLRSLGYIN